MAGARDSSGASHACRDRGWVSKYQGSHPEDCGVAFVHGALINNTPQRRCGRHRRNIQNEHQDPRSIAARLVLIGGLAASGAAIVPGVAGAGCTGNVIEASKNNQTLHGTGCDDIFKIGRYANVTIYAGNGNDTVSAGFHTYTAPFDGLSARRCSCEADPLDLRIGAISARPDERPSVCENRSCPPMRSRRRCRRGS